MTSKLETYAQPISVDNDAIMKPSPPLRGAYIPPHRRGNCALTPLKLEEDPNVDALCNTFSRIVCINLATRPDKWNKFQGNAMNVGESFARKIERFDAVDGKKEWQSDMKDVVVDWDSTQSDKYCSNNAIPSGPRSMSPGECGCALSHIAIWRELSGDETLEEGCSVLILEDDAIFSTVNGQSRFAKAVSTTMKQLPKNWDILYLGLSDRGERHYVGAKNNAVVHPIGKKTVLRRCVHWKDPLDPEIQIYQPMYGFQTHAYAITKKAAKALVQHYLPVQGPIDIWLANNNWFHLSVYCAVIANEGWKLGNGTFEGKPLITQYRGRYNITDIWQSCSGGI